MPQVLAYVRCSFTTEERRYRHETFSHQNMVTGPFKINVQSMKYNISLL